MAIRKPINLQYKTIDVREFSKLKLIDNGILFLDSNDKQVFEMEIDFLDAGDESSLESIFHERIRVIRFLEGIFPEKEIL